MRLITDDGTYDYAGVYSFGGACRPEGATHLALVMNDGEPDFHWLCAEGSLKEALAELRRYYEENESWVTFDPHVFVEV